MNAPDEAPPGAPPEPVCRRCGRHVDAATIGAQVGLCHCLVCEVYACRWCWGDGDGKCPACGVDYATVAPVATVAVAGAATAEHALVTATSPARPTFPGPDVRLPLAIGTLVIVLVLLALSLRGPFGSTLGSETGTSASGDLAAPRASAGVLGLDPPSDEPSTAAEASTHPAATPPIDTPAPTDGTVIGGGPTPPVGATTAPTATSTAAATPAATPTRAPPPPPTPTPKPTLTPGPTPSCRTVPDLVGTTVAAARTAWSAAGFTGTFNPVKGHDTMIVQTQNQTVGACLPATTAISVTYARAP